MTVTVHPRLRGELFMKMKRTHRIPGSSPLTRGTLQSSPENKDQQPVHPRLRGELDIMGFGSDALGRFIPAYAGNS